MTTMIIGDSRKMAGLKDESIHLVVTTLTDIIRPDYHQAIQMIMAVSLKLQISLGRYLNIAIDRK
jgi:hypothetical protein